MLPEGRDVMTSLAEMGIEPDCGFFVESAARWQWVREPWNPSIAVCVHLSEEQVVELATESCVVCYLSHWFLTVDGGSAAHKHAIAFLLRS